MRTLNQLTPEETRVIVSKGTEYPFSGEYDDFFVEGTYLCRRCETPLCTSAKFHSCCGWPFDQEIEGPSAGYRIQTANASRSSALPAADTWVTSSWVNG